MKLVNLVGARPQFIKVRAVSGAIAGYNRLHANNGRRIHEICVHTGQHYDYEMSEVFFEMLGLQKPEYHLGVGSGSHCWQTAEMIKRSEDVLVAEKPDVVLVYGDTNSTLAGALAAAKLQIPIAHVEAGLRSFNRRMPEETNRVLTDHLATILFAPTQTAVANLRAEGITAGVYLVGDVMYESAVQYLRVAQERSTILQRLAVTHKNYSLATVHRAENTDESTRLRSIVDALLEISGNETIVWPVHPRTRKCLREFKLEERASQGLRLIEPVSYLDMLLLEYSARVVLTDSGGVQKEARWFAVPCITLREETEWIETLDAGWNRLAGSNRGKIVDAFSRASNGGRPRTPLNPERQGVGDAIVTALGSLNHNSN
jgi:UDP-GlcNAc3NAcA epimerase